MSRLLLMFMLLAMLPATALSKEKATALPMVIMETNLGTIKIELYPEQAPVTVDNFRQYAREGFFDGLIFHRVIPGFVIQGGGFEPGMKQRTTRAPIVNEAANGLKNTRGTLSMARTMVVNSATSQFFINLANNVSLDHRGEAPALFGYAVFGKVIEGMNVVDKIASEPTGTKGQHQDVPLKDVVILKAYEENSGEEAKKNQE
jgi:peptidyl-prolyl cis-trans isomerase A (cyclophilin A)